MADSHVRSAKRAGAESTVAEINDLRVFYQTNRGMTWAVDGVSFSVGRGEILGITGESGCGKTTMANALLHLTRPPGHIASGRICLYLQDSEALDLLKVDKARLRKIRWRHLAYIPQGSMNSLNPTMRVIDQFADVIGEHTSTPRADIRNHVVDLLSQVGLEPQIVGKFPHELSGGMKQRVIIAMAMALQPDLVIADEPTTALDVNVQRVIIQTLADLRDRMGMSLIFITHDMAVQAELADRVAVMYAGRIVEIGDVRSIFKSPLHPYTRALIQAIPHVEGERVCLQGISGSAPSPTDWPSGCRFHPRCPAAMPVCRRELPQLLPVEQVGAGPASSQSLVACHLHSSVLRGRIS